MVRVSKEEKDIIHQTFPHVHIARTMKQRSKRHHYYCEETRAVLGLLRRLRSDDGR